MRPNILTARALTHARTFARAAPRKETVMSRDTPVAGEPPAKNAADPARSTRDATAPPCMCFLPFFTCTHARGHAG